VPLAGRSALVTGASSGIGSAIAGALAGAGARVAILARRADRLAARAAELGPNAVAIPCDVTDEGAVTRAVARASEVFGDVPDIIVNDAGIFAPAPLAQMSSATFHEVLAVNLIGPFTLVRAVLPRMLERKTGHLVTIGSTADRYTYPGSGAYGAAKTGARAMHEVLRKEVHGTGVRVTLVSPASVATDIWKGVDERVARPPAKADMLAADDVARAVLYAVTQPPSVNVDELRLSRA
jgi:NADP-dependent 3-hydroxy acid dehydrogenase YdfG